MKKSNKYLLLLLIPLSFSLTIIPCAASYINIDPGDYFTEVCPLNTDFISVTWSMTAWPIDVFLLTQMQYDDWNGAYELPYEFEYMRAGYSNGGQFERNLNSSERYYVVFSYVRGETILYVTVNIEISYEPPKNDAADYTIVYFIAGSAILVGIVGLYEYFKKKHTKID